MELYEAIRDACLSSGTLHEDQDFPIDDSSIGRTIDQLKWKRPTELCEDPKFTVNNANRRHFLQGDLGNCWFASAAASLTSCQSLLQTVACETLTQGFEPGRYCGAFCFQFWQYDAWAQVTVDDRLPTVAGRLIFMHSETHDEYLGALMEKAYAKLHGSYEALKQGHAADALTDLTAGWVNFVTMPQEPLSTIETALSTGCLAVASITEESSSTPRKLDNGLTVNHGYPVIECQQVEYDGESVRLLHLWDPQHQGSWNGEWSHGSSRWENLPEDLQSQVTGTGEFWISDADFKKNITRVEVCNYVNLDETDEGSNDSTMATVTGEWPAGSSDDTFYEDPQFKLTVNRTRDQDTATFTIELTQVGRRQGHGGRNLAIKFRLFRLEDAEEVPLSEDALDNKPNLSTRTHYTNTRSHVERFCAPPGSYAVVASTDSTTDAAKFVLRLFCTTGGFITNG